MQMKIIQLVNGYSKGDGVGNVITAIDKLLKTNGYETEIYNQTLNLSDLEKTDFSEENMVLYHVALSVDPLVSYLKCKKILVFHNITDPELLIGAGLQQMRNWCSAGLYDVRGLSQYFNSAIVFSEYSKKTLIESGWDEKDIYCMPIMVRFDNLSQSFDEDVVSKYSDGITNIIFTGRIFPNKKQEDIIHAFSVYKKKYNNRSRLFIVGSIGNQNYYEALRELVKDLGIDDSVCFTGRAPFSEYLAYYRVADLFLCMSAHEGFCIPLVEALYFNLPIVAVNSTAIPDTLGGSGYLIDSRDAEVVAETMDKILSDKNLKQSILMGEERRLAELMPDVVEELYINVLKQCIDNSDNKLAYKEMDFRRILSDRLSIPNEVLSGNNVVYGFGAAGGRLVNHLSEASVNIVCICDQNKGGTRERNLEIVSPSNAFIKYRDCNYIISIQDKNIIKKVLCLLLNNGISESRIYIYDEIKDEIV